MGLVTSPPPKKMWMPEYALNVLVNEIANEIINQPLWDENDLVPPITKWK